MEHWKKIVKPDSPYFGEQDFTSETETKVVTINKHAIENVTNEKGTQRKGILHFKEKIKPLILNVTNGKKIADLYGKDINGWTGKQIVLYYDPTIKVGGKVIGGTRVRGLSAKDGVKVENLPVCEDCGKGIFPANGMTSAEVAEYTRQKYNKQLCADCAKVAKKAKEEKAVENNEN